MAAKKSRTTFYQLGVSWTGRSGEQDQGNCPFCEKSRAFHYHPEKEQWCCSSSPAKCGRAGNAQSFMTQWLKFCQDLTTDADLQRLSDLRGGIPGAVFKRWGVCLNPQTDEWMIPSYNARGSLQDIRRWREGKGLQGTAGCNNNLWNAAALLDPAKKDWPVTICEGEWDAMAFDWLCRRCKQNIIVVAVPGARTFKPEWVELFKGRTVTWRYDHDSDGETYSFKRSEDRLKGVVRKQRFLRWPEGTEDKYDVRDYIVENALNGHAKAAFRKLEEMVVDTHWLKGMAAAEAEESAPEKIERPKTNATYAEVKRVFQRNLYMTDDLLDALKVICAVVAANQLPGDPLWMYVVGPPASGKTELLMALSKVPDISYHSSINAKAMLSGYKTNNNKDPSLIRELIGKVAVFKDWTEVLSAHPHEQAALYSLMRGAYDGKIRRHWGNAEDKEYDGTFGVLAGVTTHIYAHNDAEMGERFLRFALMSMNQRKQTRLIDRVLEAPAEGDPGRKDRLQDVVCAYLNRDWAAPMPPLERQVRKKVNALSRFIAILRTKIPWQREGNDKYLQYEPEQEIGVRLAKQLRKFGATLAIQHGHKTINEECYRLMHRVGLDTAFGFPLKCVRALITTGECDEESLAIEMRKDPLHVRRWMVDLKTLGMVKMERVAASKGLRAQMRYRLSDTAIKLCEEVEFDVDARPEGGGFDFTDAQGRSMLDHVAADVEQLRKAVVRR